MNLIKPKLKPVHGLLFLKDKIRIGSGVDYASEIENPDDKFSDLMRLLRQGANKEELVAKLVSQLTESEIEQSIAALDATGELNRKIDFQQKLRNTRVLVLGTGGIGSNIILSLLELGVGHITGVDFDKVELKNLNRQVLYKTESVGKLKSEQAQRFAQQFNPDVEFMALNQEIHSSEDVDNLIQQEKPSIIVNVADYPSGYIDFWVNEAAVKREIPIFLQL